LDASCSHAPVVFLGVGLEMRLSIDVGHDWHANSCLVAAECPPKKHIDRVLIGWGRRGRGLSRWGHFSRESVRNPSYLRYNQGACFDLGSAWSVRGDDPMSWRTFLAEFTEGLGRDFSRRLDGMTGGFRTDCFGRRREAPLVWRTCLADLVVGLACGGAGLSRDRSAYFDAKIDRFPVG